MAPADRPAGAAAGAAGSRPPPVVDWFDQEPRPSTAIAKLARRLLRRGRATWRIWVLAAIVGSAIWALVKARGPFVFEVKVVMHVAEGEVTQPGAMLGRGKLRAYVNDLAFTNPNLIKLMSGHRASFPRIATDPVFAVQSFRENMSVEISENDFVEERFSDDPPRSARLVVSFKGPDPELTWQVAQDLAALVIGSTMAGQRAALEADLQEATTEATSAAAAVAAIEDQKTAGPNPQLAEARHRLMAAQERVDSAGVALRALGGQHVLRFEIIDKGRVPARPDPVRLGVETFVVTALLALLGGWLLAGAFDPRVLGEGDVADLWMPVLGHLPAVPEALGGAEAKPDPSPRASGLLNPRV